MKKQILIMLLTVFKVSLTSCLKIYECQCPPGTNLKVSTTGEAEAWNMCYEQSGKRCTL